MPTPPAAKTTRANARARQTRRAGRFDLPARIPGASSVGIAAAVAATVLLHLALWQFLPARFTSANAAEKIKQRAMEIATETREEIIPDELLPVELRRLKPRLVEINPDAPNLLPPDTLNEGAATQRAAQPDADPNAPRRSIPKLEGDEADSMKVVNNIPRELQPSYSQPISGIPLGQPSVETAAEITPFSLDAAEANPAQPARPTPPSSNTSPDSQATLPAINSAEILPAPAVSPDATTVPDKASPLSGTDPSDKKTELSRPSPPPSEGTAKPPVPSQQPSPPSKPAPPAQSAAPVLPAIPEFPSKSTAIRPAPRGEAPLPPSPLPRPQAAKVGTTGMLLRALTSTGEAGVLSLDARFSEFGDYSQRMMEIIQASWWINIERTRIRQRAAVVVVEFTLGKDGILKDVVITHHTASELASYACKDAIESRAPFDPWPEEMVKALGDEDRATIVFHYQ